MRTKKIHLGMTCSVSDTVIMTGRCVPVPAVGMVSVGTGMVLTFHTTIHITCVEPYQFLQGF